MGNAHRDKWMFGPKFLSAENKNNKDILEAQVMFTKEGGCSKMEQIKKWHEKGIAKENNWMNMKTRDNIKDRKPVLNNNNNDNTSNNNNL